MYYDLNVPWTNAKDPELPRTLAFLAELGYDLVALNYTLSGKPPVDLPNPIPLPLPFSIPHRLTVQTRLTLPLTSPLSNARLKALSSQFDILALRPIDEKTLQQACSSLECDLISLDLTSRLQYYFKFKPLSEAAKRGVRLEISYAQGLTGDAAARRSVISNAAQLVRAARGRGIIISSGAQRAVGCRAPADVVNLAAIWGLKQEVAFESVTREARGVVVRAAFKRSAWRGVVDVLYGGEDPVGEEAKGKSEPKTKEKEKVNGTKRKADAPPVTSGDAKPISKREQKRQAKKARLTGTTTEEETEPTGTDQAPQK